MESILDGSRPVQTVVVCISNKVLQGIGKLQASRYGVRVITARNGDDLIAKAKKHHPELIVISHDLDQPTSEETVARLNRDPELAGVRVITIRGALPNLSDMLPRFPH